MRDPKFKQFYEEQTAIFSCCDILFFKTVVIGFTVLTTIAGAVTLGLALIIKGINELQPDVLDQFDSQLTRISTAMIVIGSIIILMSLFGCLATTFEHSWFTIIFVLTLILAMASQISCGVLTLFLRQEVKAWALSQPECPDCTEAYIKALKYPTMVAIIMLATLALQIIILVTAFKASRMRTAAKREMLISNYNSPPKTPMNLLCGVKAAVPYDNMNYCENLGAVHQKAAIDVETPAPKTSMNKVT